MRISDGLWSLSWRCLRLGLFRSDVGLLFHGGNQFLGFALQLALRRLVDITLQVIRSLLVLGLVIIIKRPDIEERLSHSQQRVGVIRILLENLLKFADCLFISRLI